MSRKGAESYFARVANEILQSAEQIVTRFEEGISVITTGSLPPKDGQQQQRDGGDAGSTDESFDVFDNDDEDDHAFDVNSGFSSPLEGMAEHVLGDIMSSQVGLFCRDVHAVSFSRF